MEQFRRTWKRDWRNWKSEVDLRPFQSQQYWDRLEESWWAESNFCENPLSLLVWKPPVTPGVKTPCHAWCENPLLLLVWKTPVTPGVKTPLSRLVWKSPVTPGVKTPCHAWCENPLLLLVWKTHLHKQQKQQQLNKSENYKKKLQSSKINWWKKTNKVKKKQRKQWKLSRIPLTLSCHPSLSIAALSKSSRWHPISAQNWRMSIFAGRLTLVCPWVGVHWGMLLRSSFLLLQHVFLVLFGWFVW